MRRSDREGLDWHWFREFGRVRTLELNPVFGYFLHLQGVEAENDKGDQSLKIDQSPFAEREGLAGGHPEGGAATSNTPQQPL